MDLSPLRSVVRAYPFLSLAFDETRISRRCVLRTTLAFLVLPALIIGGSAVDGTWRMAAPARGLLQHYGFWAQAITTPIIFLLTATILRVFCSTMASIESYSSTSKVPETVHSLIRAAINTLSLRDRWQYLFYLFVITGTFLTVVNIRQTGNEAAVLKIYGNPVYDSISHPCGFYASKLFLAVNWMLVYPAAILVTFFVLFYMGLILHEMCKHDLLQIHYFHPDNCGGTSAFGNINALAMCIYGCFFAAMIALKETHARDYATLVLSSLFATALFLFQSVAALYSIHKFVSLKRRLSLIEINQQLEASLKHVSGPSSFPAELLAVRNHLLGIRTFPYSRPVALLVNTLRLTPVMIALLNVARSMQLFQATSHP